MESTGDGEVHHRCRIARIARHRLHFKEDAKEFLDGWRLKSIILQITRTTQIIS